MKPFLMLRTNSALVLSLLLFTLVATPGCTHRTSSSKNALNIGNGAEPKDLDPHNTTGVPEFHITQNLFEGLVGKDPKTLDPVPGVATHWDVSKDGKKYTFHLRPDARWSNGDAVTADDFVYSWTRLLKPETAAEYAYQAHYIVNGKEFNSGKLKDASKLGIKAVDAHTLEVTLVNPTPFFLALVYHHSLYPVHRATIEKFGPKWTRPENMVSNGAFKLAKWEMNKVITLVPNPHYWARKSVKLEEVNMYPVENADTEEKMFRSKLLHITEQVPLEKLPYWQEDKTGVFQTGPYLGSYFYWFNCKKAPLNNKLVRQALVLAIDREQIVKYVTKGHQLPATMFVPPGVVNYDSVSRLPKDLGQVERAKKLLAQAGYGPGGKPFPKLEILYNTMEGHKKIAQAIQEMWKNNLGIEVSLINQEWKVYLSSMHTHNFEIGRQGWIGDYNDANTFLDLFETGNGNNLGQYSNPKYDQVMATAAKEKDLTKRAKILNQAEEIILDDVPVLPIYIYTRNYLKRESVQGWYPNIEDLHPLRYVSLSQ